MSIKYRKAQVGFSPEIENLKMQFKGFNKKSGRAEYNYFCGEDTNVVGIGLVKKPANESLAVYPEYIDDNKNVVYMEEFTPTVLDVTSFLIKEKNYKWRLLYKWKHWKNRHKVTNISYEKFEAVLRFGGYVLHVHNDEHREQGKAHLHIKHKAKRINIRIDFNGNYLSTVKKYNGMDKGAKDFIKKELKPYLKRKQGKLTGKQVLIGLWNKNNPDLLYENI